MLLVITAMLAVVGYRMSKAVQVLIDETDQMYVGLLEWKKEKKLS